MALMTTLNGCDIQPVSVGSWNIEVDTANGMQESVWSISADGTLGISGDNARSLDGVVLEGSRVSWTDEVANPEGAPGEMMTINFSGTVDGDRLQGTLFSTLGNLSVSGSRQ